MKTSLRESETHDWMWWPWPPDAADNGTTQRQTRAISESCSWGIGWAEVEILCPTQSMNEEEIIVRSCSRCFIQINFRNLWMNLMHLSYYCGVICLIVSFCESGVQTWDRCPTGRDFDANWSATEPVPACDTHGEEHGTNSRDFRLLAMRNRLEKNRNLLPDSIDWKYSGPIQDRSFHSMPKFQRRWIYMWLNRDFEFCHSVRYWNLNNLRLESGL
jgi:hypothetical protein